MLSCDREEFTQNNGLIKNLCRGVCEEDFTFINWTFLALEFFLNNRQATDFLIS